MAEGVVSYFAGNVLAQLSTEAFQELAILLGLEDDVEKLKSNVSAIQAVLPDAEERSTDNRSLKDWLNKLGEALYDADDVLDEISTQALRRQVTIRGQVRTFLSTSNQRLFKYKMAHKAKKIWERLDEIYEEFKNKFQLTKNSQPRIQYDGLSSYFALNLDEVIGRDGDKMYIKSLLLDTKDVEDYNVSFIAIVGMGGIGKTTLAKLLYNDDEVSKHFELTMWVWVSDQFDVERVVEQMIEITSGYKPNVKGFEALRVKLQELIGGRKYLLVMDDVWNESEEKWKHLKPLLMEGARGSKILITKRNSIVPAEVERITKLVNLSGLTDSSSWSLFQKVAFKEDRPNMNQLGKEILEECKGVPLVIRYIGRLLYSKFSEEEWISFKNDELSRVTRENNYMTNILALSYKHLPPHLKQCFAYSSLYPKYQNYDKDQLLKQWVAHGFVQSREESKSVEDIANDYFMDLCLRFFYEHHGGNNVGMNGIMCDIARMVAGAGYVFENLKDVGERTHHLSLCHDIKSLNDLPPELLKAKGLRTLRMPGFKSINEVDLDKLVSNFPRLRVLDLSGGNIKMLPDYLNLKRLRYLDLSENPDLQSLPYLIGALVNLQTLNLNGCKALTQLPEDINKLVNLRHLELVRVSKLTHMPKGIGKLTCLQTLSLFVLDENKQGSKLSELKKLRDLRGELYIKGLEQLMGNPSEAGLANLKEKKGLRDLILQWKHRSKEDESEDGLNDEARSKEDESEDGLNDATVLEGLEFHPNVESVSIWSYKGEGLPNWLSNPVSKLTHISLAKCNRLQCLPPFDQLPALTRLHLDGLTSLQFLYKNNRGSSSTSVFFPSLKILILNNMPNLEGWWEGVGDEESEKRRDLLSNFALLTELSINDCPKLGWVPRQPCLERVELDNVGVGMVRSIGPSFNLEYVTLKNIWDLEYLPRELQASNSSIKRLNITNCPNFTSLPRWTAPTFVNVELIESSSDGETEMTSPEVIVRRMRKSSKPYNFKDNGCRVL